MSTSNHRWVHMAHYLFHTETGKNATRAVMTGAVAAAPVVAATAVVVAPLVAVGAAAGAAAYGLWRLFKD
jgi:hypothetical protein